MKKATAVIVASASSVALAASLVLTMDPVDRRIAMYDAADFLRKLHLAPPPEPIALELPAGYRAVGLRVDFKRAPDGYASVVSKRVDLLRTDTETGRRSVFLENVQTLDASCRRSSDVVILALSPENVIKVHEVRERSTFTVLLR